MDTLSGAVVSISTGYTTTAVDTPDDPNLPDGFYSLYAPAGTVVFTATYVAPYGADVQTVTVPSGQTLLQDLYVPAGLLDSAPDTLHVTVALGYTRTFPLSLDNLGGVDAEYELLEVDRGMLTATLAQLPELPLLLAPLAGAAPVDAAHSGAHSGPQGLRRPSALLHSVAASSGCLVAVMADVGSGPNEIIQLHQTLDDFGYAWVDVATLTETQAANADVLIDRYGAANLPLADINTWLGEGNGYIQLGDWPDLFPLDWESQPAGTPLTLTVVDNAHPLMAGLSSSWTGLGFWAYDWTENALSWTTDGSLPNLLQGQYPGSILRDRVVSYEEIGAGRAVFIGLNTYGSASGEADQRLLWNAIAWSGENGGCAGVPWLSESPVTAVVPPGSHTVGVTFDASVPEVPVLGDYFAVLRVVNDTPYGQLLIPITMTVITPQYGVELASDAAQSAYPNTSVVYTLQLTNTSNGPSDTFTLSLSGNAWTTTLSQTTVGPLDIGETVTIQVTVQVPAGTPGGATDVVQVTATSQGDNALQAQVTLTTTALSTYIYLPFIHK
jgi:hypothetical protein